MKNMHVHTYIHPSAASDITKNLRFNTSKIIGYETHPPQTSKTLTMRRAARPVALLILKFQAVSPAFSMTHGNGERKRARVRDTRDFLSSHSTIQSYL